MATQQEALCHYIQTLLDFEFIEVDGDESAYTHMGALLVDAGLQAGIKYETVVLPRVTKVLADYPEAKTTRDFQRILMIHGATNLLNWQLDRKINMIVYVTQFFITENIETVVDLRRWLLIPGNLDRLKQIKGVGPKTADYFKILAGIPVSAIDRHLYNFMERAGVQVNGYDEAQKVIKETAKLMNVSERSLDYSIWKYMAG